MKKIIKPLFFITSLSLFVGCSEDTMDDINRDRNNANDVPAKMILSEVITSSAFYSIGGDFNTYASIFVEHEAGINNQFYQAETRNGIAVPSTFNNAWRTLYRNIKDTRVALAKCSIGGDQEGNYPTKGIAEVLLAINSAILADNFGDAPYSQAAVLNNDKLPLYMTPVLDKQEVIYKEIFALLDAAIDDLAKKDVSGTGGMTTYDFLYGGNTDKWTKLAYGLKARYTMQTLHRSADKNGDLTKILDYISKSFTSAEEQAAFNVYNATNLNPLFDVFWSRSGFAASESLSKKLITRNDPRLKRVFFDKEGKQIESNTDSNFLVAPNGQVEQKQGYYNTSVFGYAQTASTLLMSYHELLFLKAEAEARLGQTANAQATLKQAIVAAIANAELSITAALTAPTVVSNGGLTATTSPITTLEAESYFDTSVLPLFTADPIREIMIQKYLGTFGASGESPIAYNDIRRLKALGEGDFIELQNPLNTQGLFPLRCVYGSSDTTTNPNVKEATGDGSYIYNQNVWWAGGSR